MRNTHYAQTQVGLLLLWQIQFAGNLVTLTAEVLIQQGEF